MSISTLPIRPRPDGLYKVCEELKDKTADVDSITENLEIGSTFVRTHVDYGILLGFIEESDDDQLHLTDLGTGLAYQDGITASSIPYFLEGIQNVDIYLEFLDKLNQEKRPDENIIRESEMLRILQTSFDTEDYSERELESGIRSFFMTLEAGGLGEYHLGTRQQEARIELRGDVTVEKIRDGDPEELSKPGTVEVADPYEEFHNGFDEQLLTKIAPQFRYGHYPDAVGTAYTVLEDRVRNEGSFTVEDYGSDLMSSAFGEDGPLSLGEAGAEKEGFKLLFMGSYMALRNPPSHRILDDMDKQQAKDALSMVNFLLTLIENRST